VVDYGHNVHSLIAVIEAIDKFPQTSRICVYTTAGDRRDIDIIRQGELLGEAFDRVVLYEDHYKRGRADGEIMGLLRQGLKSATRAKEIIEVVGANKACETAMDLAQPGELVLMQADTIDETVQWLRDYLEALAAKNPTDESLDEPVVEPIAPPSGSAKKASPAEMEAEVLAVARTVAKV
jgi:cyanophycin synthetase